MLPEYGLSRADERLLRKHAEDVVQRLSPGQLIVAELGSGSGKKTRWILEALRLRQPTVYCPIEISPTALAQCAKEFADMDGVTVCGLERPYLEGLQAVAARRRAGRTSARSVSGQHHREFRPRARRAVLDATCGAFSAPAMRCCSARTW